MQTKKILKLCIRGKDVIREHERNMLKLNVWAGMFHDKLMGPFFFDEDYPLSKLSKNAEELFIPPSVNQATPRDFSQRRPTWPLGTHCLHFSQCHILRMLDQQRWSFTLASTLTRHKLFGLFCGYR